MRDIIEINKELIPYAFNILLAEEWFELYIDYNKTADMFTASLYKDDELVSTEPLILGSVLFRDVYQPGRFPAVELVPFDTGGDEKSVTYENLGQTVFLTIDDEGEVLIEDTTDRGTASAMLGKAVIGIMVIGA